VVLKERQGNTILGGLNAAERGGIAHCEEKKVWKDNTRAQGKEKMLLTRGKETLGKMIERRRGNSPIPGVVRRQILLGWCGLTEPQISKASLRRPIGGPVGSCTDNSGILTASAERHSLVAPFFTGKKTILLQCGHTPLERRQPGKRHPWIR